MKQVCKRALHSSTVRAIGTIPGNMVSMPREEVLITFVPDASISKTLLENIVGLSFTELAFKNTL